MAKQIYTTKPFGNRLTIALYGPEADGNEFRMLPLKYGARGLAHSAIVRPAGKPSAEGFLAVRTLNGGGEQKVRVIQADAVRLHLPGSGLVMRTADCLVVVLYLRRAHEAMVIHAGRPAMTPRNNPDQPTDNILSRAYTELTRKHSDDTVCAHIGSGICGKHFLHDDPGAAELAPPFQRTFGDKVFFNVTQGALDLKRVVTEQLLQYGVAPENIVTDTVCTAEHEDLVSYRATPGTYERNGTLVLLT